MSAKWGDIPVDADTEPGIAAIEREHITKPRQMELDGPLLHQPVRFATNQNTNDVPIECVFGDSLIGHTIALNQHVKKLKTALNALQQPRDNPQKQYEADESVHFLPTLPSLESGDSETIHGRNRNLHKCFESKFRQGKGEAPPEITEQLAKKILRKAVAVICAHAGFETTTESVLEALVDIVCEYYLKLTHLLRCAVDREALVKGTSFPDVLEQVFYEIGIGSMQNLASFYRRNVIDYHSHVLSTCQQLTAEYKKLKNPEYLMQLDDCKQIKIKDEVSIHFPAMDDHEENHPEAIQLDELQNLQAHFEPETTHIGTIDDSNKIDHGVKQFILSLHTNTISNLDADEEIVNVIDSPIDSHAGGVNQESNFPDILSDQQSALIEFNSTTGKFSKGDS